MRRLRANPVTHWIAILALLLASAAPSMAYALGTGTAASWVEVCSGHETRWVLADAQEQDGEPAAAHPLAHCPGCLNHGPAPALAPPGEAGALLLDLKESFPPAFLQAPRTLHAWRGAQPRGPPPSA